MTFKNAILNLNYKPSFKTSINTNNKTVNKLSIDYIINSPDVNRGVGRGSHMRFKPELILSAKEKAKYWRIKLNIILAYWEMINSNSNFSLNFIKQKEAIIKSKSRCRHKCFFLLLQLAVYENIIYNCEINETKITNINYSDSFGWIKFQSNQNNFLIFIERFLPEIKSKIALQEIFRYIGLVPDNWSKTIH